MCTTEPAGGGLGAGVAAVALIIGSGIAYSVFVAHPVGTVATFTAIMVVAIRPARRAVFSLAAAGLVWLWRAAARAVVRAVRAARARRAPAPAAEVAVIRQWRVTVYEPAGDTNRVITRGEVEGTWSTSTEVEAETIARAVERFGYAEAGQLRAHAELVTR